MSGGDLVGVWWGSERGLGIPLDTTQTPPKHPRPLSRHLRDTLQNPARLPPDTLQTPSTPLPDPHQTPLRPKPPIHPHIHPQKPPVTHPQPPLHRPLPDISQTLDPHFGFGLVAPIARLPESLCTCVRCMQATLGFACRPHCLFSDLGPDWSIAILRQPEMSSHASMFYRKSKRNLHEVN